MPRMARIAWRTLLVLVAVALVWLAAAWAPDIPVEQLAPQWAKPPSKFIAVKGQRVHVRDEGPRNDAEPIVLIHGTGASLHTWDGWAAGLRGERRVVRFDLPGFGLTGPNAKGDYRDETYARFVLDTLDALELKRVVLVGNSLGGEVAWRAALAAPERVARLVLVDSAGYDFVPESVPIGFRIARMPVVNRVVEFTLPRRAVESSVRNVFGDPSRVTDALVDRYLAMTLREGNRRAMLQRFAQIDHGGAADKIATIRTPTLILWGAKDRLIPIDSARRFAKDIPGSQLVVFEDLGHIPHEEDPNRSVIELRRWLAGR